jgi:diguanylate cyclase (GGDEF)-like protein
VCGGAVWLLLFIAVDNKILQSVVKITRHRDLDSFEYSLVATMAELVPVTNISILKTIDESKPDNLDVAVGLTVMTDEHGDKSYAWADGSQIIVVDKEINHCQQSTSMSTHHRSDGHIRLLYPVTSEGRIIGVIDITSNQDITDYLALIEGFLKIYNNYIIIFNESECDKLTGLYNRRTFENKLQRLFHAQTLLKQQFLASGQMTERRKKDPNTSVWLVIFDIDRFKRVNDEYGHVFGDEVILTISQILKDCFRNSDIKFRIGGEEFVIILEPATLEKATELLEKFRNAIADHRFSQVGTVTISIGFAKITDRDYPPLILECADKALYYAKEHGRNCVHNYEALLEEGKLTPPKKGGLVNIF